VQSAQIIGKDPLEVCALCLLTKLLGCDIMENSDRGVPSRAAEALERGGDFSPLTYYFISAKNFCNLSISVSSFTHPSPISTNSPYTQVPTS
jgi:hypothetical protein